MLTKDLVSLIQAENLTPQVELDREITCAYSCDLLSWVMSHGKSGMAWITVQMNMNVIAVAVLADMACIVLPESIKMDQPALEKAVEEGIAVLSSPLSAYEISGMLYRECVPGAQDG